MRNSLKYEQQYEAFYKEYFNKILAYCNVKLRFDQVSAEDCAQRVFETLYEKMKDFYSMENVRAWLYRTADNYIKKRYREWSKENETIHYQHIVEMEDSIDFSEMPNYDDLVSQVQIEEYKEKVISGLSKSNKELYQLRFVHKSSYKDLALQYETSENTMRQRVFSLKREIVKQVMNCFE
ncbi:MAG TPA: sigma-70 family RNA polymerase sigma factor [Oscillospiraceae bacterium]|nr:sigma-70 family RNA polymerase sigma factor [Oscillospiraceae bacterium]